MAEFPDKWVVIRLSALGDVALTTGVLEWWGRSRNWRFVFVTRRSLAPILKGHPALDGVEALDEDVLSGEAWRKTCAALARQYAGYGLLDLHGSIRSRILARVWKGPVRRYPKFSLSRRFYLRSRWARLGRRLSVLNVPERYSLAVERTPPARGEILPRVTLSEEETARALEMLRNLGGQGRPVAALHPYATHPNKAWPAGHWNRLVTLLEEAGWDWFIVGRGEAFADLENREERDFTNRTDLRQTCALLAQADVLVTNDSGPMHLATATGTTVVALFGPTNAAWGFYPSGPADVVLEEEMSCRPCSLHGRKMCPRGRECLVAIEPERALLAVEKAAAVRP